MNEPLQKAWENMIKTKRLIILISCIFILSSCTSNPTRQNQDEEKTELEFDVNHNDELIDEKGNTLQERIKVPEGFERIEVNQNSYEAYLRNLSLKPHGSKVKLYNGEGKNLDVYVAVIDIDVGDRDLQQCADAVIRLRAEYLYRQGLYDQIHFNFTNGFTAYYSKWMQGNRIAVKGNDAYWYKATGYSNEYSSFRKYLDMVFAYAGTLSLSEELENIPVEDMKIGDVFLKGGSPGHAVIIVDMAENISTGEKLFMMAQSNMPAQDIHIFKNLTDKGLSPWYSVNFQGTLITPEWDFKKDQLVRFNESF